MSKVKVTDLDWYVELMEWAEWVNDALENCEDDAADDLRRQLEEVCAEKNGMINHLRKLLRRACVDIDALEKRLADCDALESDLALKNVKCDDFRRQLKKAHADRDAYRAELEAALEKSDERSGADTSEYIALKRSYERRVEQMTALQDELILVSKQRDASMRGEKAGDVEIERLRREMESLTKERDKWKSNFDLSVKTNEDISKRLDGVRTTRDDAVKLRGKMSADLAAALSKVDALTKERDSALAEVKALEQRNKNQAVVISNATENAREFVAEICDERKNAKHWREMYDVVVEERTKLRNRLLSTVEDNHELAAMREDRDRFRDAMKRAAEQRDEWHSKYNELRRSYDVLTEPGQSTKKVDESLRLIRELEDTRAALTAAELDVERMKACDSLHVKQRDEALRDWNVVRGVVKRKDEKIAKLRADLDAAERKHGEMKSTLAQVMRDRDEVTVQRNDNADKYYAALNRLDARTLERDELAKRVYRLENDTRATVVSQLTRERDDLQRHLQVYRIAVECVGIDMTPFFAAEDLKRELDGDNDDE